MKNKSHITRDMLTARIQELRESLESRAFPNENFDASIAGGAAVMSEAATREYIRSIIDNCYELPKELTSGRWPYRHITIDYEAAIDEAMGDYTAIELDGQTFYCR